MIEYLSPLALFLLPFVNWLRGRQPPDPSLQEDGSPIKLLGSASAVRESIAGVLYRSEQRRKGRGRRSSTVKRDGKALADTTLTMEEQQQKLMTYERLFFQLDEDASLEIDADECALLLSYAVLDLDPDNRACVMKRFDVSGDGKLNRFEFCKLCVEELWDVSFKTLDIALENMTKARSSRKRRNNAYWNRVANRTDSVARAVVPTLYLLTMVILFSIDMSDDYDSDVNVPMFSGFGHVSLPASGIAISAVYCAAIMFALYAWFQVSRAARKKKLAHELAIKSASADAATRAEEQCMPPQGPPSPMSVGSTSLINHFAGRLTRGFNHSSLSTDTAQRANAATATQVSSIAQSEPASASDGVAVVSADQETSASSGQQPIDHGGVASIEGAHQTTSHGGGVTSVDEAHEAIEAVVVTVDGSSHAVNDAGNEDGSEEAHKRHRRRRHRDTSSTSRTNQSNDAIL